MLCTVFNIHIVSNPLSPNTEPPAPPTEVNGVILGSYNNFALISWLSPSNGPCPVTRYLLQLRRTDSDTKSWTQVSDDITSTAHVVENLERGVTYMFRVCAMNEIGCGLFSQPSPPLTITDEPGESIVVFSGSGSGGGDGGDGTVVVAVVVMLVVFSGRGCSGSGGSVRHC